MSEEPMGDVIIITCISLATVAGIHGLRYAREQNIRSRGQPCETNVIVQSTTAEHYKACPKCFTLFPADRRPPIFCPVCKEDGIRIQTVWITPDEYEHYGERQQVTGIAD